MKQLHPHNLYAIEIPAHIDKYHIGYFQGFKWCCNIMLPNEFKDKHLEVVGVVSKNKVKLDSDFEEKFKIDSFEVKYLVFKANLAATEKTKTLIIEVTDI